jgi:hypothetical protein
MDDEGIQKVWNANVRTRPASSAATRIVMAVSASAAAGQRQQDRRQQDRPWPASQMITCGRLTAGVTPGTGSGEPGRQCARPGVWPRAWLVLAALAGAAEASSPAETPSEQAATSSAQATVLRRRTGRGVSHSRAAPAR